MKQKQQPFLADTAKRNHYPENDLFIRPLAKFFDKEIEGILLTTDGAISWHCCFGAYTEYDLEDFITNCIYKNMNILVYTEFYDDSTLLIYFYKLIMMVPMEYRDPKRIKSILIDIEKRAEINPSRPLDEVIQLAIQGLSTKHEALGLSQGQFTSIK